MAPKDTTLTIPYIMKGNMNMQGGEHMANNGLKLLILIAVLIYVVSPVDFAPGPIDDAILMLIGYAATKKRRSLSGN